MNWKNCVVVCAAAAAGLSAQPKDMVVTVPAPLVGGPTTVAVLGGQMVGGTPISGAPYSADAVTETTQTLADGNRIVRKSATKIYRDSAGRERREETLPGQDRSGSPAPSLIMISDPVGRVNYSLDSRTKTGTKIPLPGAPALSVKGTMVSGAFAGSGFTQTQVLAGDAVHVFSTQALPAKPAKSEDLGQKTIEGVLAQGTRTTTTIAAGQVGNDLPIEVVDERWFSPELQVVVMSKHSDPRMGETTYQLTNVSRVEPDPSLFQIPADYQVNDLSMKPIRIEPGTPAIGGKNKDDEF